MPMVVLVVKAVTVVVPVDDNAVGGAFSCTSANCGASGCQCQWLSVPVVVLVVVAVPVVVPIVVSVPVMVPMVVSASDGANGCRCL